MYISQHQAVHFFYKLLLNSLVLFDLNMSMKWLRRPSSATSPSELHIGPHSDSAVHPAELSDTSIKMMTYHHVENKALPIDSVLMDSVPEHTAVEACSVSDSPTVVNLPDETGSLHSSSSSGRNKLSLRSIRSAFNRKLSMLSLKSPITPASPIERPESPTDSIASDDDKPLALIQAESLVAAQREMHPDSMPKLGPSVSPVQTKPISNLQIPVSMQNGPTHSPLTLTPTPNKDSVTLHFDYLPQTEFDFFSDVQFDVCSPTFNLSRRSP